MTQQRFPFAATALLLLSVLTQPAATQDELPVLTGQLAGATEQTAETRGQTAEVVGHNAEWGAGRGFADGQTVPDIPLMDLQGNEVRFSAFLGKRYIIYCWASW